MALKMSVKITGADELARRLNLLGEEAKKIVEPAAKAGAEMIQKAAKENAEKGKYATGELAKSIKVEPEIVAPLKVKYNTGTDKYYAGWVEKGHPLVRNKKVIGSVPPHPFLRPALDENKSGAKKIFEDEVRKGLGL